MSYRELFPRSQKEKYLPLDILDFVITAPNETILMNKFRISGKLKVTGIPSDTRGVNYDPKCGIHSFFNNFMIQTEKNGYIQNLSNYPRYVKMNKTAHLCTEDFFNSARYSTELMVPREEDTSVMLCNSGVGAAGKIVNNEIPFSFMPVICLNGATTADGSIPALNYQNTGSITISLRLVSPQEALYGNNMDGNISYEISDLRLTYISAPLMKVSPCSMLMVNEIKQILNSSATTVNVNLPVAFYSMSSSFLQTSRELNNAFNNVELEMPKIEQVHISFNDNTSGYVAYPLTTQEDILQNYLDSFQEHTITKKSDFTLEETTKGTRFGVGIAFADSVQLTNSTFTIQLQASGITSDTPYYIYMFFRSITTI